MDHLQFVLAGKQADAAAARLSAVLGSDGSVVTRRMVGEADDATRRVIDLIALATLILSIPGAVLAAMDLADRIGKRRHAQAIIDTAKQIQVELSVETRVIDLDGKAHAVTLLTADHLLEIAAAKTSGPGA